MSRFIPPFADVGKGISPSDGAKYFFFESGTSTPKNTFSDEALTTPNTNPVISDSNGLFPDIWLESGKYKVRLTDKNDTQKNPDADPISGLSDSISTGSELAKIPRNSDLRVDTILGLRNSTPTTNGQQVSLLGYTNPGVGGDSFWYDSSDTTSPDDGINTFVTSGGERWKRINGRLVDSEKVGALGNGVAIDNSFIQLLLDQGRTRVLQGTSLLSASLKYKKDQKITGEGKSFSGTIFKPDGDFPAFEGDLGATDHGKLSFSDFQIEAENITTDFAMKLNRVFTTEFENIWIRNTFKGVEIIDSDSVTFRSVMIMEDSDNDAVLIGEGSRSIRFYACNFEKNPANSLPGGVFRVNSGNSARVADAYLYGCQFERGSIIVENGIVQMNGGKMGASSLIMLEKSQSCFAKTKFEDSGEVFDIGFSNIVEQVHCRNMSTPRHEWPVLIQATPGTTPTFGAVGEEFLFLVTAGDTANTGVTNGVIEIKDGATVLDTSPTFDLPAVTSTIGLTTRQLFTNLSAVKIPTTSAGPIFTNSESFGIAGGKNLLTNGTFDSGTATGWSLNSVATSASGSDVLLTPSDTSWGIFQVISSICQFGKRYLAVARFNGNANLILGNSWDGTVGARALFSEGFAAPDGSGDQIAMIAFDYQNQRGNISLGKLGASTAVTVKYFMMIEVD